jgi:hypothetical protein
VGIARRVAELYEMKINALLDRAEDPLEMPDYSCARHQDYLQEMREAAVDLGASRKRSAWQEGGLRRSADRLRTQAGTRSLRPGSLSGPRPVSCWSQTRENRFLTRPSVRRCDRVT